MAPTPVGPAVPGQVDAVALRAIWPEVLAAAKQIKRRTEAMLRSVNSQVHSVEGANVVITASTPVLARMLADASNIEVVQTAIGNVLGGQWRVSVVVGGESGGDSAGGAASAPRAPTPPPPDDGWPTVTEPPRSAEEEHTLRASQPPPEEPIEDYDMSEPVPAREDRPDPGAEAVRLLRSELGATPMEEF
jgi:DNA polymerase-3 subunit gamma/tau